MKKILAVVLSVAMVLAIIPSGLIFATGGGLDLPPVNFESGCDGNHQFTKNWQTSEKEHWNKCDLCEQEVREDHTFGEPFNVPGVGWMHTCSVCSYTASTTGPITEVVITGVPAAVEGEALSAFSQAIIGKLPADVKVSGLPKCYYYNVSEWTEISVKDLLTYKLLKDTNYKVEVALAPASETGAFDDAVTVTVNGAAVSAVKQLDGTLAVTYEFTPLTAVSELDITGVTDPVEGVSPLSCIAEASIPETVTYNPLTDIALQVYNESEWEAVNPLTDVFEYGKNYRVVAAFAPAVGYAFPATVIATVNGNAAIATVNEGVLNVVYALPAVAHAPVASVAITGISKPEVDANINTTYANVVFPETVTCDALNDITVEVKNDAVWEETFILGGKYEEGKEYRIVMVLSPAEDYSFAETVTATVNGETATATVKDGKVTVVYELGTVAPAYLVGDFDNDSDVDSDDAIFLLRSTMFVAYERNQPADFDHDGAVTSDDAIYLLRYTLFGEGSYPLDPWDVAAPV